MWFGQSTAIDRDCSGTIPVWVRERTRIQQAAYRQPTATAEVSSGGQGAGLEMVRVVMVWMRVVV